MYQSTHHKRRDARGEVRNTIDLEAIVTFNEPNSVPLKEIVAITSVSRNGVGMVSPRATEPGQLINVVWPMPDELRIYDRSKELYAAYGLVQYCVESNGSPDGGFHLGVALIGKRAPESFIANPLQSFRINGMSRKGLWTITEANDIFKARKHPRYLVGIEVNVNLLHKQTRSVVRNTALTRDIGIGGAAIISSLDAQIGDKVKFACEALNFYALALVRNRENIEGNDAILRLEFLETEFPVEKLSLNHDDQSATTDHPSDIHETEVLEAAERFDDYAELVEFVRT